ncbi:CAF17-like 4Fe-4S cluster assembly/insertion protein YgfZ [Rhodovarius lipocyclicus]|uniref:CAF17-like 4Fe-4S cluster assembly/insertion protein YgfZ n=1 Tax=Rhodovarius lipocyclicus TaxID=268410 RepID=UPI00135C8B9B|nr:folate-binding protein [Rhodovarius lipocyclicus]
MPVSILPQRGVVVLSGADRVHFLQGLVSNDVAQAAPGRAVWSALLTPQGKWLADFFVFATDDALLLDVEREQAPMLVAKLSKFRLRSKVALEDASDRLAVLAGWGEAPMPEGAAPDPRLPEAGWRALVPPGSAPEDPLAYAAHRLSLGLPDGSADMRAEQSVLLEAGFDELHGVSWEKGCYMGQELTARTKYRGLVKRRLVPVAVEGPLPAPGTPVLLAGEEVGEMRSGQGARGMALLRLAALGAPALECGGATLRPETPAWMKLPAQA